MGLSVIHWSVECGVWTVVYGPLIEDEGGEEEPAHVYLDRLYQKYHYIM